MSKLENDSQSKIHTEHLSRMAYIYVRQSTPIQVERCRESQRRQYDLAHWAATAGWPPERVLIIDEDQGKSGSLAQSRTGFMRLASAVGRGEVGIVASLEASRLARNSPDWHHLLYLCRWTGTLVADEHMVYDLSLAADRMVLGIRGQVSEMELDSSIHRMIEARWNQSRRGEATFIPPAGYEFDEAKRLVLTSDEAVASSIRLVFQKFAEIGSVNGVFDWWCGQHMPFPIRQIRSRSHPVVWKQPSNRMLRCVLHHPIYAGAYVFGRTKVVRELDDPGSLRLHCRRVSQKDWPVLIQDHHPAYISFETFVQNQEKMRANTNMTPARGEAHQGPAREGRALLQGLARCGHCGRNMLVSYGGQRGGRERRTLQYRCMMARRQLRADTKDCQNVGGSRIDNLVVEEFLEAIKPAGVDAMLCVQERSRGAAATMEQHVALLIEKAAYEAQRAERQFMAVEPENRIVARELERRWNERLAELATVRAQAEAAVQHQQALSAQDLEKARHLGKDLQALWNAQTTTNKDRKRLLRCLIQEVQLRTEQTRYLVRIVWRGGAITDREVSRRKPGTGHITSQDIIELVQKLAPEFDDTQIARILNRQGRRTGFGHSFTRERVLSLRGHHHIAACPKKRVCDPQTGPFTADEAARELDVTPGTIHHWLREGVLAGEQATLGAPWRIFLTAEVRRRLSGGDVPPGWVGLSEAARRLGLSQALVAYQVKTGKLPAVRVKVGNRQCWKIDVSSASCRHQPDLFDPMTTEPSKEA